MNEKKCLEQILKILKESKTPKLPIEFANNPLFIEIYEELKSIRETTYAFSGGDFSHVISARSYIPGCLKALQADLRHLIWQVQMVEKGDFSQKVHFMGDFSTAFNSMVDRLRSNVTELQEKEKSLTESEARFKFLASHDPLTGIYNRRSFVELLEINLEEAAEKSLPFCIAMMDIDHFKKYNDTFGHQAGDKTLRHVVRIVSEGLRKNDFMGRYGGEEFIFFFHDTKEETGFNIVERLRKKIAKTPLHLENGTVSIYASFGLVEKSSEDFTDKKYIQKLINDADSALYAAKKAGRNRVIVYKSTN